MHSWNPWICFAKSAYNPTIIGTALVGIIHIIIEYTHMFQAPLMWKTVRIKHTHKRNNRKINFRWDLYRRSREWNWINHTTCTKASPIRCNGSQISSRLRSSSRNCWCMLKMAGTIRKISSTVCASISAACSCDFSGFKYFYSKLMQIKKKTIFESVDYEIYYARPF